MISILDYLLSAVLIYGYPVIVLSILIGATSIPIPTSTLLLAAGSFTYSGTLNFYYLLPIAIISSILGDIAGYMIAKSLSKNFFQKVFNKIGLSEKRANIIEGYFLKWGFWSVFFTRWLITPIGVPINIICGMNKYSFKKFFTAVAIGETLWVSIYVYLGYLFGVNWQSITEYLNNAPYLILLILIGSTLLYLAFKNRKAF